MHHPGRARKRHGERERDDEARSRPPARGSRSSWSAAAGRRSGRARRRRRWRCRRRMSSRRRRCASPVPRAPRASAQSARPSRCSPAVRIALATTVTAAPASVPSRSIPTCAIPASRTPRTSPTNGNAPPQRAQTDISRRRLMARGSGRMVSRLQAAASARIARIRRRGRASTEAPAGPTLVLIERALASAPLTPASAKVAMPWPARRPTAAAAGRGSAPEASPSRAADPGAARARAR